MTPYDQLREFARRLKDKAVHEKVARPRDRRLGDAVASRLDPLDPVTTSFTLTVEPTPDARTN